MEKTMETAIMGYMGTTIRILKVSIGSLGLLAVGPSGCGVSCRA